MKKIVMLILSVVVLIAACKKENVFTYHGTENIYFDLDSTGQRDSLLYTFAYHPEVFKDTVWVRVRISGDRDSLTDRKYVVKVVDTSSTAVAGKHYEPLKSEYIVRARAGITYMPVILYNTDTNMLKRAFTLTIRMEASDDYNITFSKLITARIVFSSRLEKPYWWDMWLGGYYSQVKHQLFRLAGTTDELTTEGIKAPKYLFYVDKLKALLASPSTWVQANPTKGYMLTARPDGNFDFYPVATPTKIIPYVKDPNTGQFYFIDENGNRVI